ncbi:MAG: lamin tail domain-containing protein [Candidatus Cloacimonetes bacterium]|nr:lamin tail domain-containing protein [Candidatus Cloacimonadota bacterium]
MKKLLIISLGLTLFLVSCSLDSPIEPTNNEPEEPESLNALCINEYMSHNDAAWAGPNNDFPDWIELYNGSDVTIDVGGMYITDDLDDLTQSMIGDNVPEQTTLDPGDFLVLIADGTPENGPLHLDMKLSDDEDFALVDSDGTTILDQRNTSVIPDDQTEARIPDGTVNWEITDVPTAGGSNN